MPKQNKIAKFFKNIFYGLPFGLKKANEEINGGSITNGDDSSIHKEVEDERVAKHLLKGELTESVKELRYRTYKVANESQDYKYLGNGIAVKEENKSKKAQRTKFKFSQGNELMCASVLQELQRLNSYGIDKYRFEMTYNSVVRFKLETMAKEVNVVINEDEGEVTTTLHFSSEPDPYNVKSTPFVKELEKLYLVQNDYTFKRSDIANSLQTFSFTTYKASNEDDFVNYSFLGGAKLLSIAKGGGEYLLTYSWDEFIRLPLDLESKYYSKSMDEKYKKHERKKVDVNMANTDRKCYCSICGKEMSTYDADLLRYEGKPIICTECAQKMLKDRQ